MDDTQKSSCETIKDVAHEARLYFDRGTLVLEKVTANEMSRLFEDRAWRWDGRISAWRCEAVHYGETRAALARSLGRGFSDEVPVPLSLSRRDVRLPLSSKVEEAFSAWQNNRCRGTVVLPDPADRIHVGLKALAEKKTATLIVTHHVEGIYGWHEKILDALRFDAGVILHDDFDIRPVTLITYKQASFLMHRLGGEFGLVIFDEAHHLPTRAFQDGARLCCAPNRLGLTPSPERPDNGHLVLDELVGPPVFREPAAAVNKDPLADIETHPIPVALFGEDRDRYIRAGGTLEEYLANQRAKDPHYGLTDLLHDPGEDPEPREAKRAYFSRKHLLERAGSLMDAVSRILKDHEKEKKLVLTPSEEMAVELSSLFLVPALLQDTGKEERLAVLNGFARDRFSTVVTTRFTLAGMEARNIDVAVILGQGVFLKKAKHYLLTLASSEGILPQKVYEVFCDPERGCPC